MPGIIEPIDVSPTEELYMARKLSHKCRKQDLVTDRQIKMAVNYIFSGLPLSKVGAEYGKDHATVIHAIKQMYNAVDTSDRNIMPVLVPAFREKYEKYVSNMRNYKTLTKDEKELAEKTYTRLHENKFAIAMARRIKQ